MIAGPTPNVDIVLSICLQSDIPTGQMGKSPTTYPTPIPTGAARSASGISGSNKSHPTPSGSSLKQSKDKQSLKRKDIGQDDDETTTVQSQPQPRDFFRIRQMKKARGAASSQTGSASYGSAVSGDLSGSTGWFNNCNFFLLLQDWNLRCLRLKRAIWQKLIGMHAYSNVKANTSFLILSISQHNQASRKWGVLHTTITNHHHY